MSYQDDILQAFNWSYYEYQQIKPESPLYVTGEWQYIISKRFNFIQDASLRTKMLNWPKDNFFHNINHISGPACITKHPVLAQEIGSICKAGEVICELGAGMGGLACNILNKYPKKNLKYIIFDLYPSLFVSSIYLSRFLEQKLKIFYYTKQINNIDKVIKEYDIILLPHHLINLIQKPTWNMCINTGSLCEMSLQTIKYYLSIIDKYTKSKGHFFSENAKNPKKKGIKDEKLIHPMISSKIWKNIYTKPAKSESRYEEALYQKYSGNST